MSEEKSAGCIFGPANGTWVKYRGDTYIHREFKLRPKTQPEPETPDSVDVATFDYEYREFWFGARRVLVPRDWDNTKVMDNLMRYAVVGWQRSWT